jgi:hypothetical protein
VEDILVVAIRRFFDRPKGITLRATVFIAGLMKPG